MPSRSWFSRRLLPWYHANRRDLPWRHTTDPYLIWLSEVLLQQTRVGQGLSYYLHFASKYPTVAHLAAAGEEEVLRDWQGLGYYTRARNLRETAQRVVLEQGGRFPADHAGLLDLKGVGPYTAAAIASIAYGEPVAVVDGNVYRVLARVFGIHTAIDSAEGRRLFADLAQDLLDGTAPGTHNQAVMELGATVCTPRNAACNACPLSDRCVARACGVIDELPVKQGRTAMRERWFNYLLPAAGDGIWLCKRTGKDIWRGLYEPPLVEHARRLGRQGLQQVIDADMGPEVVKVVGPTCEHRHILSHQVVHARVWAVQVRHRRKLPAGWKLVDRGSLARFPVPRLVERILAG